jgi:hypothetical protein
MEPMGPAAYQTKGFYMPRTPRSEIKAEVFHCYKPLDGNDKVYVLWIENRGGDYFLSGAYGKRTITGLLKVDPKGSYATITEAERRMFVVSSEKVKKGYISVESTAYINSVPNSVRVRFEDMINDNKIDTSRLIGHSLGPQLTKANTTPVNTVNTARKQSSNVEVGSGRVRRSVNI